MDSRGYFVMIGLTQLVHAQEEIWANFHKRWFVFTMPRWIFITFEVVFSAVIVAYIVKADLAFAGIFVPLFCLTMFVNGIGHIVWGLVTKKYVPGLVTAPILSILFVLYFISLIKSG